MQQVEKKCHVQLYQLDSEPIHGKA
jgi:hypothetical protein